MRKPFGVGINVESGVLSRPASQNLEIRPAPGSHSLLEPQQARAQIRNALRPAMVEHPQGPLQLSDGLIWSVDDNTLIERVLLEDEQICGMCQFVDEDAPKQVFIILFLPNKVIIQFDAILVLARTLSDEHAAERVVVTVARHDSDRLGFPPLQHLAEHIVNGLPDAID